MMFSRIMFSRKPEETAVAVRHGQTARQQSPQARVPAHAAVVGGARLRWLPRSRKPGTALRGGSHLRLAAKRRAAKRRAAKRRAAKRRAAKRLLMSGLLALALLPCRSGAGETGEGIGGEASRLVRTAASRLTEYPSISANVRHRIDLFGRRTVGSGIYRQFRVGRDILFRTEFKLSSGEQPATFLQVCDGRFLWTRLDPSGSPQDGRHIELTRVDLNVVRDRVGGRRATSTWSNDQHLMMFQGGLPQLLLRLDSQFEWQRVTHGEIQGVPMWMVSGPWRPAVLARLTNHLSENMLPDHLPHRAAIALGQDDLIPYRIDFRQDEKTERSSGRSEPLVTLELFEVQIGTTMDSQLFVFKPGEVPITDVTEQYLNSEL
jgi:hypothetical protein